MSTNNAIYDRNRQIIGFRCHICDQVKSKMWGNVCNECRSKTDSGTTIKLLVLEIERIADQLEKWATQSVTGGWSTHQVDPMRKEMDRLRLVAAQVRRDSE